MVCSCQRVPLRRRAQMCDRRCERDRYSLACWYVEVWVKSVVARASTDQRKRYVSLELFSDAFDES